MMFDNKPHLFEEGADVILQGLVRGRVKKHLGHNQFGYPKYRIEFWDSRSSSHYTEEHMEITITRYTEKIIQFEDIIAGDEIEYIRWDNGITNKVIGTAHSQGAAGGWFNERGAFFISKSKEDRRILLLRRTKPVEKKKTAADYRIGTSVTLTFGSDKQCTYIKTGDNIWYYVNELRGTGTYDDKSVDECVLASTTSVTRRQIKEPKV